MYYTADAISKKFKMSRATAYSRFVSRYAKERWGVIVIDKPDGSKQRVVPEEFLHLWKSKTSYRGRRAEI